MRCSARRTLVGATFLLVGIVGLNLASTDAADNSASVPEADFKTLLDQDIKQIDAMIVMGKKGGDANTSRASRAIKASGMMIAAYAQSRMGAKGEDDAKLASLRDAAIKVGVAGAQKKFTDVEMLVKALKEITVDPKAEKKKINLIAAAGEFDLEELMCQLKKKTVGGLGIEEEIRLQAKKPTITPERATALAQRVLVLADYCDEIPINGGFNAAKPKKAWDEFNKDMRTAARGVITAAGQKDPNAIKKAFDTLDLSCIACHDKFKNVE